MVCRGREVNFDVAYSFGSYEGTLRDLIRLFKYSKIETLSKPLSRFLVDALPRDESFDLVTAMPMHWYRRWQRGFNQAELLAKPVARKLGLKASPLLRRVRLGKRQAGLGATDRRKNLKAAFRLARNAQVEGKRILLIDDVLTTGTTVAAATAALKEAGARRVSVLTVARVMRRSGLPLPDVGASEKARSSSFDKDFDKYREKRRAEYGDDRTTA
jgi:ComF family protein